MYLSKQDVERLTGKKRPSAQIVWLKENGYKFSPNGLGEPIVLVAEVNRKLLGGTTSRQQEPNWDVMLHG